MKVKISLYLYYFETNSEHISTALMQVFVSEALSRFRAGSDELHMKETIFAEFSFDITCFQTNKPLQSSKVNGVHFICSTCYGRASLPSHPRGTSSITLRKCKYKKPQVHIHFSEASERLP
jgi:hypothetical protein